MKVQIIKIASSLHQPQALTNYIKQFLTSIEAVADFTFEEIDETAFMKVAFSCVLVQTGGTEEHFKRFCAKNNGPFYLLTTPENNSLPAAMEILSYLQSRNCAGEIIHGDSEYIAKRLSDLAKIDASKRILQADTLGVIGKPSDWLIASNTDYAIIKQKLGVQCVDIPMLELQKQIDESLKKQTLPDSMIKSNFDELTCKQSLSIYDALKRLTKMYDLQGITVRCFDLLESCHNTGCLGLAILNSEGITGACEGDVPTLITMHIINRLLKLPAFQANPARLDLVNNEIVFTHCTVPLSMTDSYQFETHFESNIGIGIRGKISEGEITIFKMAPDLASYYLATGHIMANLNETKLCRTQIKVKIPEGLNYYLQNPLGNHHVIIQGNHLTILEAFCKSLNARKVN